MCCVQIEVENGDLGAVGGEQPGRRQPNAAWTGGARDNGDFALQEQRSLPEKAGRLCNPFGPESAQPAGSNKRDLYIYS